MNIKIFNQAIFIQNEMEKIALIQVYQPDAFFWFYLGVKIVT